MRVLAVIIPAFGAEHFIESCVSSIQAQLLPQGWGLDIRIGVDGCLRTKAKLEELGLRFYYSDKNVGAYIMRNSLIALRGADAFFCFDSDDVMERGALSFCLGGLANGADIVVPSKINTDETLSPQRYEKANGGAMMFTSEAFKLLGGFAPARIAADSDFVARAKMAKLSVSDLEEPLYYRRRHQASLTNARLTGIGSQLRKETWAELTGRRESGVYHCPLVTTDLQEAFPKAHKDSGLLPVYILIRTSRRPLYFARMMDSVNRQTYANIVTIVHTDNAEDDYATGDIVIHGEFISSYYEGEKLNAPYNLYCNRLLEALPDTPGWYIFLDDDDMLYADDVIERLVANAKEDCINIGKVSRYGFLWPKNWGSDTRLHTECFFLSTKHKKLARWWGNRGGDHDYSCQLSRHLPPNWIEDLIIAQAQEGKGWGNRLDRGMTAQQVAQMPPVTVLFDIRVRFPSDARGREGEIKKIPYRRALELAMAGKATINPTTEQIAAKREELFLKRGKIIPHVIPDEN